MKKFVLLSLTILMLSCTSDNDIPDPINCTEIFVYGLKVTAIDGVTGSIIANQLTVKAIDGSYEEQLMRIENSDYFIGAGERQGNYIIEITSNDYQTFLSANIIVAKTEDGCHVITEELEFTLQPN